MRYSRLFAGISFLVFVFAFVGTVLSIASGNVRHFEDVAARQPALARSALRAALQLNPRDSTAWIALGLATEGDGDMEHAGNYFLEAEKIDRQYLPAWTSANFFFRHSDDFQFWRAAARAAAMSYDDPAPLIELTDRREPEAIAALERLGDTAHLERGYLRYLIGQSRWREAEEVAARLSLRNTSINDSASDRELLLDFTDRLIRANEGEAALAAWNGLQQFPAPGRANRGTLVNRNFLSQPSGHGFDWRVTKPPRGSVHWEPSKVEFWLPESTGDACPLLEQWVVLDPGRYRLRFEYRTAGLAEKTGLHWILLRGGRVEASSAALASVAEWNFRVTNTGLYELAWIYTRVPGTVHREGRAEIVFANLDMQ